MADLIDARLLFDEYTRTKAGYYYHAGCDGFGLHSGSSAGLDPYRPVRARFKDGHDVVQETAVRMLNTHSRE